ncbi:hypothetical protein DFH09DRAFT_1139378 [Mycena vulgaris]|nr:hypothetical protein DFH09DRAFT_1139378 [Mycena vulgaris]
MLLSSPLESFSSSSAALTRAVRVIILLGRAATIMPLCSNGSAAAHGGIVLRCLLLGPASLSESASEPRSGSARSFLLHEADFCKPVAITLHLTIFDTTFVRSVVANSVCLTFRSSYRGIGARRSRGNAA